MSYGTVCHVLLSCDTVSMSLRELKRERTRQSIVDTAFRLFAERGFDGVTVAEIAAAAEVGTRTLHRYFTSKEELVFPEDDDLRADLARLLAERPEGEHPETTLAVVITPLISRFGGEQLAQARTRDALITSTPAATGPRPGQTGRRGKAHRTPPGPPTGRRCRQRRAACPVGEDRDGVLLLRVPSLAPRRRRPRPTPDRCPRGVGRIRSPTHVTRHQPGQIARCGRTDRGTNFVVGSGIHPDQGM